jgi:acylaminoacyl-peptidase
MLHSPSLFLVSRSIRDWDNQCRQRYEYTLDYLENRIQLPPCQTHESIVWKLTSPSGQKLAVLKKVATAVTGAKKAPLILELWIDHGLVQRIELSPKIHGNIIHDPTGFGMPVWSPDENYLLYSAERAAVETLSFWDNVANDGDDKIDDSKTKNQPQRGGQNVLHQGKMEEWGEKHVGQSPLLDLFLLRMHGGEDKEDEDSLGKFSRPTPKRIANVPGTFSTTSTEHGITLGQALFHPDGQSVVYTGWDAGELGTMPRRLGFIFCRNRPSKIYQSSIDSLLSTNNTVKKEGTTTTKTEDVELPLFTCLTPDHALSRSPQFAKKNGKSQLIFLSNPQGFYSHDGCMGLYRYDTSTKSIVEILEVVQEPYTKGSKVAGMGFPGLFLSQLPPSCGQLENFVFLSTIWGSIVKMVRIDLRKEENVISWIDIQVDNEDSSIKSQSILCGTPEGGWIVSEVALNQPARILHVPGTDDDGDSSFWTQDGDTIVVQAKVMAELSPIACTSFSSIRQTRKMPSSLNRLELISIEPPPVQGAVHTDTPLQSLLMLPQTFDKTKKIPLVVVPHGGPHSCSTSSYIPGPAFLCDSGYAVLFPNYRGSIGFGQASIESLLTRVGSLDVEDIMAATNHVLETMSDTLDASRVGICGGSHGGFLTGHCCGQYPDFFKAAVMRNPVTNIATMTTATDIADWCYTEVFGTYHWNSFRGPTADELQVMWSKSPVAHESKVKTPTMIALGMVDLRVPPSQGLEWYHSLRSRGVPTKLLVYPEDCHALDKVTTEADHWIHIKQWFDEHL